MRRLSLALGVGILSGLASTVFLYGLSAVTLYRQTHELIIWGLPLAGLLVGWVYQRWGGAAAAGHRLILDELHEPRQPVPLRMVPLILISTWITHLFGGSAGREGTAVQMGGALSDQLNRWWPMPAADRRILLTAGLAAGFGSAVGAPCAGLVFGLEVVWRQGLRFWAVAECALAAFAGYGITWLLRAPHSHYPTPLVPDFSIQRLLLAVGFGLACGVAARLFLWLAHGIEHGVKRFIKIPPLRPALAGIILVTLYSAFAWQRYAGLGIETITSALQSPAFLSDPLIKGLLTALTVGSGFKGGEFVPLVFIGTTLGSATGIWFPDDFAWLAATGFAAVFAGAAQVPWACSVMAIELFGWPLAPYVLIVCLVSSRLGGRKHLYSRGR